MKIVTWFKGPARACCCAAALLLATAAVQAAAPEKGAALLEKANQQGTVRVIVELTAPQGLVESAGRAAALASVQEGVLERVSAVDAASVKRFEIVPGMALSVDAAGLKQLLEDPAVYAVQEDVPVPPTLYQSIPLIDANDAWSLGFSGGGQTVAILDTGVTKTHPFLSGKVVSEACYSTTGACGAGCTSTSLCPGGVSASTAVDSGLDCPAPAVAGCGHGTHVAGIAAGGPGTTTGGTTYGVAKDAKVIAIKVFSRFNAAYCQSIGYSSNDCALTYTSDQIRGLERVYALRNSFAIAAANMSLGGGRFYSPCDTDSRKAIIDTLRNAGTATVISSGNNGYADSTGAPGCISTAITVGSTTKSDVESSFSNAASWLDLLAPGSDICSSVNGWTQNCGTGYGFASGTSMAAPHVTGAWAVMKSKNGVASVSAVETALENTGKPVNVGPVGNKPRIDLDNALNALAPGLNLGFQWDHCQQVHRDLGSTVTWCWLEGDQTWIAIDDEEGEESLIEAGASNHWIGVNVSAISGTSFTINFLKVYKY